MFLMRILPGVLKELVKHVPTVLFEAVEWHDLASEIPRISRRLIQKEGYSYLFECQKDFLGPLGIKLTNDPLSNDKFPATKKEAEAVLTLYFAQIFSPVGLFLDLRPQHFDYESPYLKWHPTGLWTKFSDTFREGLLEIYDGFYLDDEDLYLKGLIKIGVASKDWPEEDLTKLGDLFRAQFGSSLSEEMSFDLQSFKSSLLKVIDFLMKKKVKISTDFLYLGIYLVTMYSSLEKGQQKLNVKKIYVDVKNKLHISGASTLSSLQ